MIRNPLVPFDLESRIVVQFALLVMALLALITLSRVLHPADAQPPSESAQVGSVRQQHAGT